MIRELKKELKKKILLMAFLIVLVLTFTPMMSVYAEVQLPANIKFKCQSLGACFLLYTSKPWYLPPDWYGDACGNIALGGYAKATSYDPSYFGGAYVTAPGDICVAGFIAVKWFENRELHQLSIAIYSKPTSQGAFGPETDEFVAGIPSEPAPGWEEPLLSFKGIYKIGSNFQYVSGSIMVGSSLFYGPESIIVYLWFGDWNMNLGWMSESIQVQSSWDPDLWMTIPAAKIIVHDVKLL